MKSAQQSLTVRATSAVDSDGEGQRKVWVIDDCGTVRELVPD
jgi:hypothetical protein